MRNQIFECEPIDPMTMAKLNETHQFTCKKTQVQQVSVEDTETLLHFQEYEGGDEMPLKLHNQTFYYEGHETMMVEVDLELTLARFPVPLGERKEGEASDRAETMTLWFKATTGPSTCLDCAPSPMFQLTLPMAPHYGKANRTYSYSMQMKLEPTRSWMGISSYASPFHFVLCARSDVNVEVSEAKVSLTKPLRTLF